MVAGVGPLPQRRTLPAYNRRLPFLSIATHNKKSMVWFKNAGSMLKVRRSKGQVSSHLRVAELTLGWVAQAGWRHVRRLSPLMSFLLCLLVTCNTLTFNDPPPAIWCNLFWYGVRSVSIGRILWSTFPFLFNVFHFVFGKKRETTIKWLKMPNHGLFSYVNGEEWSGWPRPFFCVMPP